MDQKDLSNINAVADILKGREYGTEMDGISEGPLKEAGIVVVFGYSDDNVELRGAISEEVGSYGGIDIPLTPDGILTNRCGDDDCPYFQHELKAVKHWLQAVWDKEGYSWIFKLDIPYATFDIMEDGEKYCRGIVFRLADIGMAKGKSSEGVA